MVILLKAAELTDHEKPRAPPGLLSRLYFASSLPHNSYSEVPAIPLLTPAKFLSGYNVPRWLSYRLFAKPANGVALAPLSPFGDGGSPPLSPFGDGPGRRLTRLVTVGLTVIAVW
jgi:hypothetical protein